MEPTTATRKGLEDRFETAAEGAILLLVAALLLPEGSGEYAAVAVVGGLLLLLNAGRLAAGLRPRWFSITIGAWAVICGVGALAGAELNAASLFFLLLGLVALGAAALGGRSMLPSGRRHAHA